MALWYADEVVEGRVPCCKEERQACKRFLDMYQRAHQPKNPFFWSDEHVIDVCDFGERLPHVKAFEGYLILEPVQCFWLAAIFGFRERRTNLRWVRTVSLWVPRKNTKTTISAIIVLYCATCENEPGPEITISAGSEGQAKIPYDIIKKMVKKEKAFAERFQVHVTNDFMLFEAVDGKLNLATSKAENLDGYNPSVVLAEELHAQSQKVIGVLKTAMGSRRNPLWVSISTAGRDVNSAAYEDWKFCQAVLDGRLISDRVFCVIYAASEDDLQRKFDPKVLEKFNPMWGISLNEVSIEEEAIEARKGESKLQEYLRTRANRWTRAAGNLISIEAWNRCADHSLALDAFKGYPVYVGIDLASRNDLNAAVFVVEVDNTVYAVSRYWLPEASPRLTDDRFADDFYAWMQDGAIHKTRGAWIDYEEILAEILKTLKGHNVVGVGLDDYQANLMASAIEKEGHRCYIVPKQAKFLTNSTEDIIARVLDPKLFQHDGNPVSDWCAGNVCGRWDEKDNVLPKKESKQSKANIDGFDSLIIANALRLDDRAGVLGLSKKQRDVPNPYHQRGLLGDAA